MNVPMANRMDVRRGWLFHCAEFIYQSVYATVTVRSVHDTVRSPPDVEDRGPLPNIDQSDFDRTSPLLQTPSSHHRRTHRYSVQSQHPGPLLHLAVDAGRFSTEAADTPCASEAPRTQSLPLSVSLRGRLDITPSTLTTARQRYTRWLAHCCCSTCNV